MAAQEGGSEQKSEEEDLPSLSDEDESDRDESSRGKRAATVPSSWVSRSDNHKKSEFIEKMEQFAKRIAALERERNAQIFNKRSEFRKDFSSLDETETKLQDERKQECKALKERLGKMQTNVGKFHRELTNVKPTPSFVEKLKETMEEIENNMMMFKEQQREVYNDLMIEERTVFQEISALEKRIDSWAQMPAPVTAATNAKKVSSKTASAMPPAVAAFEKFLLQTGGHQGGWDDYDHQLFLKLRKKFKNKDTFLQTAGASIPGRSLADIKQHEEWYTEYLQLRESKRQAINQWKNLKESEKVDLLSKLDEDTEEDEKRKKKHKDVLEAEREERLAKLSEWKLQKEIEKTKEEEARLREELKSAKEKEREEKRKREVKARAERYARQKEEEQAILKEAEEARQAEEKYRNKITSEERQRLQERNERIMLEKKSRKQAKEQELAEKEKRLQKLKSQVEVHVERDPSRLYQLTAGWKHRAKDESGASGGGPVLQMPHRAVPSWRQGLS